MKRTLSSTYRNVPEGEQVLRIAEIDESKYKDFQKLVVIMEDKDGLKLRNNFDFVDKDGNPNDTAEGIFTRMCRAALNDQTLDECDTKDLIGQYVTVEVVHKEANNGGIYANIAKWIGPGEPFAKAEAVKKTGSAAKKATGRESAAQSAKAAAPMSAKDRIAEMRRRKAAQ